MRTIVSIFTLLILSGCSGDAAFTQIGYFKDTSSNRVMIYQATRAVTASDLSDFLSNLANTDSRFTIAYIFDQTSTDVRDVVTTAPDYLSAIDAVHSVTTPPWQWRMVIKGSGVRHLIDCTKPTPDQGNCQGST